MAKWTALEIPPLTGRSAVITGTGGLGFEDALALARAGAEIIVAGRNPKKGNQALARIRAEIPGANVAFEQLDLASLNSVEDFGARLRRQRGSLDILINNAGIMVPPERQQTEDGFELQFGTNYLGHFALTAHLMPLLVKGSDPRVVSLSSIAARQGKIDFADLQSQAAYIPMQAYSQSKLACLMFAFELQRRSEAGGWGISSFAAHPGISRTDLLHNAPGRMSVSGITRSALWFLFQPAAQGALPTLFAATAREAKPGAYYGPNGLNETRGHPAPAKIPPQAADRAVAARLWEVSEGLSATRLAREFAQ
ncbi:SDR family oxidoreductase [Pelagibacterium halotolerans]|uniref:Putative oxidoreductase/Short-chain dehydrogenase n=1 Tax=Pelagibacterium halotolerans (strain DSM 22347 / JCM 15775 / CGMCC 1.7692 / B2) TaxID=1082931 RepID=G4R9D1_PELHB|nr:SDR family oxidoreductase [Pelagibacterium halotolerans]AEQ53465.1 putative oxidoreductase/Short-chain dehydrogenase [Pelagibacterium halotolerans B2]QJR20355.1 SDR family oxidoreductase [Pelagibacterium halotolerans]SEA59634.1 NAD(P)-dependent dehydrogenase, short-chain alcohol dehydrogenase family [Pelagibacterium halotolerans]